MLAFFTFFFTLDSELRRHSDAALLRPQSHRDRSGQRPCGTGAGWQHGAAVAGLSRLRPESVTLARCLAHCRLRWAAFFFCVFDL